MEEPYFVLSASTLAVERMLLPEALRQVPSSAKAAPAKAAYYILAWMTWLHARVIRSALAFGTPEVEVLFASSRWRCQNDARSPELEWTWMTGTGLPCARPWAHGWWKCQRSQYQRPAQPPSPHHLWMLHSGTGQLPYFPIMCFLSSTDWWQGRLRGACAVFDSWCSWGCFSFPALSASKCMQKQNNRLDHAIRAFADLVCEVPWSSWAWTSSESRASWRQKLGSLSLTFLTAKGLPRCLQSVLGIFKAINSMSDLLATNAVARPAQSWP